MARKILVDDPFDFAEDAQSYGFEKVLISVTPGGRREPCH